MNEQVYHFLKYAVARLTFFVYTIPIRLKNFIQCRITRKIYNYRVVKTKENLSETNLAIVALYPRPGILNSVNRLIDGLIASNYFVLIVMNQSSYSSEWLNFFSNKSIEVLLRPNIGRDFGAYKIGYLYAEKKGYLKLVDNLLFANDSVYYGPASINFIKSMLEVKLSWTSQFVNYQFHTHAQSFFQVFNKKIFLEKNFSKFWHHYKPSDLRHRSINDGEVALSTICLKLGYHPVPFVNANRILTNERFQDFTFDEKFGIWSNLGLVYLDSKLVNFENTKFLMRRQYLEVNITHHQGLLASRVLKAPLKLDIFQTGQVTIDGVKHTLMSLNVEEDELTTVLGLIIQKGTHASKKGFNRLWSRFGYV